MTTVLGDVNGPEKARESPLDESTLSRAFAGHRWLAPTVVAVAIGMAIGLSFWFGYGAERPALEVDTSGFTVFAGLFLGALAIERLTELLIAPWVGPLRGKISRTIVIGSIASVLGVLVAGSLGLYLLEIFTDEVLHTPPEQSERDHASLLRSLDVFITGMAIAGGTKPLHDLITGLEKNARKAKSEVSEEAPEATPEDAQTPYRLTVEMPGPAADRQEDVDNDIARIVADASTTRVSGTAMELTGTVGFRAGTRAYASAVYDRAYRLAVSGYSVEPELAAPADLVIGSPVADPTPMEQERRWALDQIGLTQAVIAGAGGGAGIKIGHPDTGYRPHPVAPNWDTEAGYDFVDDDADAFDPFVTAPDLLEPDLVVAPGHGTGTASVLSSPLNAEGELQMHSVAPQATVIPYRVMRGPVHLFDADVARAVNRAVAEGCRVISMSLGGFGFSGLRTAIREAVDAGVIVVAAGGNQVGVVVSPADYPETIAVASSTVSGSPYFEGSSQGPTINITAPGTAVWRASFDDGGNGVVEAGVGTSYATTHVAGVAALWLSRHGQVLAGFEPGQVPRVFAMLLAQTANAWDDPLLAVDWGPGVINAAALLDEPLPDPADPETAAAIEAIFAGPEAASAVAKTAAITANLFTGEGTNEIRVGIVAGLLKFLGAESDFGKTMDQEVPAITKAEAVRQVVGHEAAHHYRVDPQFRSSLDGDAATAIPQGASPELAAVVTAMNRSGDESPKKNNALQRALRGQASVRGRYRWIGLALVAAALLASAALAQWFEAGEAIRIVTSASIMIAAFYVAAQALERTVEYTFGRWVFYGKPDRATDRALILLGVTLLLGCLLSGLTGFRIVEALAGGDATGEADNWSLTVGVFVTGLAIGGGTKPLHDLLTRIQVASKRAG